MSDQEKTEQVPVLPTAREPFSGGRGDVSWRNYSDQWQENHGTALMIFAGLIFAIGSGVLFFQQNRFRPVAFPSGESIESVRAELIDTERQPGTEPEAANADGVPDADSQSSEASFERHTIIVRVTGAADTKGKIRLAIYRSPEHFNDSEKADWKGAFSIGPDKIAKCEIPWDAVAGRFAMAGFQDANDNSELDKNAIGIPTERYGFSNAARGKLGPPAFDEAVMDPPKTNQLIELKIW